MSKKMTRQATLTGSSMDASKRIKILSDYGSQVEVDKTLALKLYFRSGREMLRMANMYCDDGQLESAFILYSKFITLFIEKLRAHPDFKSAPREDLADIKRKVKKVFPIAEELKSQLKKRYAEEERVYQEEQQRLAEERAAEEEKRRKLAEEQERKDEELAKKLQEEEEAEVRSEQEEKYWKLRKQEEERLKEEERRKQEGPASGVPITVGDSGVSAPEMAAGAAAGAGMGAGLASGISSSDAYPQPIPNNIDVSSMPPPPSYSQYLNDIGANPPEIPDRELKKKLIIDDASVPVPAPEIPNVDRSKKPLIDHHMSLGEFSGFESGQLRTVIVPSVLLSKFLTAAEGNTAREAETMAILCGKMAKGCFKITNLFIPKQKGGHDSCDMENEEELIYYQDEHNLITLGWIHTHPTQTAFLSSVDLHSHFPWQKMMPEAIAIVCSPKFQETGIFKLTDHGLSEIGSCQEKGFHPHSKNPPLFESCSHVQVSDSESVVVEDRRK